MRRRNIHESCCGMVQAYGVAAAIGHPIIHYREVNLRICPLMNTTVLPLKSGTSQSEIDIMCMVKHDPAINSQGNCST